MSFKRKKKDILRSCWSAISIVQNNNSYSGNYEFSVKKIIFRFR
jgi:hypothetical protein